MMSAANQDTYGNQAWGDPSAGNRGQHGGRPGNGGREPFWQPGVGPSRPVGIAMMVLGFILWWPVGLAMLFYMIGSGRLGGGGRRRRFQRFAADGNGAPPWGAFKSWACGEPAAASSGNRAFDEYRTETLKRLEDEQQEFGAFLERLRFAKDKAEFDEFMADRRSRPPAAPSGGDATPN